MAKFSLETATPAQKAAYLATTAVVTAFASPEPVRIMGIDDIIGMVNNGEGPGPDSQSDKPVQSQIFHKCLSAFTEADEIARYQSGKDVSRTLDESLMPVVGLSLRSGCDHEELQEELTLIKDQFLESIGIVPQLV